MDDRGIALGAYRGLSIINKFGENPEIDTSSAPEDVWNGGGIYTGFPDGAAETLDIFSSSASDAAAGVGMRTIRLEGLDANGYYQTEDMTLNGTTAVTTTATWTRMSRAFGLTGGSSQENVGTITIRHTTTTANVFGSLPPTYGQTAIAAYTIPMGKKGLLTKVYGVARSTNTTVRIAELDVLIRHSGTGIWRRIRPTQAMLYAPLQLDFHGGYLLPELCDIKLQVEAVSSNSTDVSGGFDIMLVG